MYYVALHLENRQQKFVVIFNIFGNKIARAENTRRATLYECQLSNKISPNIINWLRVMHRMWLKRELLYTTRRRNGQQRVGKVETHMYVC